MQQLLRSSCQMLTHHMKPLHHPNGLQQPLRTLQQAGALVVAPRATLTSSGCKGGCRAAAVVQHASTTSSKWQPLLSQQSSAQQQQLWRGAVGSSSRQQCGVSARRQQHVCFASSSQPADSSAPQPSGSGGSNTVLTLPTILTLGRVAAIPALIAAWFWHDPAASTAVTALFIVASLTDWLDGYLARKMNASTPFGAFLDPVADKLMVAAVLILLSTQPLAAGPFAGNTWFVPVATLVIIGREISMSALREWAATLGPAAKAAVAVNAWGKWKTATQMVALTCLLLTKDGAQGQLGVLAAAAGPPLLAVAAWLTAHSLALYVAGLWKYMK